MIANEKQYKITKAELKRFEEALASFDAQARIDEGIDPRIVEVQKKAIKSQIESFKHEVTEYELLKSGEMKSTEVSSFEDLPALLIKARIAQKMTQAELAHKLGMKEQQIQRYEADKYASASLKRLTDIATALSIKISGDAKLVQAPSSVTKNSNEVFDKIDWTAFPIAEMYSRGWLGDVQGSLKNVKENAEEILYDFFIEQAKFSGNQLCLHRKNARSGSKINYPALYAWQARVLIRAQEKRSERAKTIPIPEFRKRDLTGEWINQLVRLSPDANNLKRIEDILADKGIIFVIEPHLQGTFLDGAAMLLARDFPVIAMTLRYDRIDNFWFVLMHELGHVLLHLGKEDVPDVIFDDCDEDSIIREDAERENEADQFALESLIPEKNWKTSPARFSLSENSLLRQAKIWNIHPGIIAGRLRKETKNWALFNNLVGRGEVRKQFDFTD